MTKHIHKDYNSGDTVTQTFKNYYTSDGALEKVEETMVPVYNYTTYKFDSKGRIIQKIWKNSKYKNVAKYEY